LADAILVIHLLFVCFVVLGFALILLGMWAKWAWTRNRAFRLTHLAAIAIVVAQAWFDRICPLTAWENRLRELAGQSGYSETFIQHWLHKILFYQAEPWVFTTVYTVFGILVLICWLSDWRDDKTGNEFGRAGRSEKTTEGNRGVSSR
jgi:4-amino-4-deoxy-L-arabinose transferase-like glycosyltransferase